MRISELSRRSGVPVTTIKYYLREGLLPPGRPTAANQADYDESHARRLRLVRALVGVRGLSVSAAKDVLSGIGEHEGDVHQLLGIVLGSAGTTGAAAAAPAGEEPPRPRMAEVDALLDSLGWEVSDNAPTKGVIAETLETLGDLGIEYDWKRLVPYAELAGQIASVDLDGIQDLADPLEQAERALVLTFLLEPVLMALRRLAQEHQSAARRRGPGQDISPAAP